MRLKALLALVLCAVPALAQLTPEQKVIDFQELAALFSKRYAFYEWKKTAFSYDSLDLTPWIARVQQSKDDLTFFEICSEYVARNQDGHTSFLLPSTFRAQLPFSIDLYDGTFRIDRIDRKALPVSAYPFEIGDEVVSIDGVSPADGVENLLHLIGDGNLRSRRRDATTFLTLRPQTLIPRGHQIEDGANITIRSEKNGLAAYTIPWVKQGIPYTQAGPSPVPRDREAAYSAYTEPTDPMDYLKRLRRYQTFQLPMARFSVGRGEVHPVFDLPASFVQRLGAGKYDDIFSGTFQDSGLRFGFLRIPTFLYFSNTELTAEITYLQANTDGLIIDIMRNPGGYGCAAEQALSYLFPGGFHSAGNQVRVTWDMLEGFQDDLDAATRYGGTADEIASLQNMLRSAQEAYRENRGFTVPLPLCGTSLDIAPARNKAGAEVTYSKPIMVLTDELSASAAEIFAAVIQDEGRALLYGMRTDGAGGAVFYFDVGVYMEGGASLAQTRLIRKNIIKTSEYPPADYVENIGVRPDIVADYMTLDNLRQNGKPFVDGFVAAMVEYVKSKR
ncbi:MAG: hypothetical protein C5B51_24860 [Terriglobia bacterium]|nr:MAG: hypothetical protein C5B51_24860 [Terriglobia bacterium]